MHRNAFDQLASLEREHWWFRGRRAVYLDLLRTQLRGKPGLALDLGTGCGGWLPDLARIAETVVALEPDPEMAALARGRDGATVLAADANHIPLADDCCALVTAFDVFEHLDDDLGALREACRVLEPDGLLALSVPAHPWLFSNNDRIAHHKRRYTRRALATRLREAGLHVHRLTYANALLFPLIAPALLGLKGLEHLGLFGNDPEHTNLSLSPPGPLGELCYRAFAAERHVSRHRNLPFGHSLFAMASPVAVIGTC